MPTAIGRWLERLTTDYEGESDDALIKRVTGWRAEADTVALLYATIQELRAIREVLQRQIDATKRPKR